MKTRLLHAALFTPLADGRWGLPLLLWGPPGVAKTATLRALGQATGLHTEILSPGERGEGAFGVTPVPTENGHGTVLEYPPPDWIRCLRIDDEGNEAGIIVVDEANTAPPALQPALLGIFQERRIGGHQCGPRVRVFAAANPVGHAAGGWDWAAPVSNRHGHIDWPTPDATEWAAWLISGSSAIEAVDALQEEARVLAAWPAAWAKASGLIAAFISRRPELIHKMPADSDQAQSRAWPSPRTWEMATRAMAAADVHGLDELETDELVAAFVGAAAAGEFITWIEEQDLPDPVALLDGAVSWQHDPARLDRTDAVLSSCTALVVPTDADKRDERVKALWRILAAVMRDAKDLCYVPMTALTKAGVQKTTEARPVLAALNQLRKATKGVA